MAARGRGGRGRGYTPPTGAALYLKRSAEECGLDDRNLRSLQDITTPALFPDILWHSNGTLWRNNEEEEDVVVPSTTKWSSSTHYLIQKGRELRTRMQAQHQVGEKQEQDVVRYRNSPEPKKRSLGAAYIPQELLQPIPKLKSSLGVVGKNKDSSLAIKDLEELERKRLQTAKEEEDAASNNGEQEEESEEEELADYTMNYYESEGDESDGGGDGEPTF